MLTAVAYHEGGYQGILTTNRYGKAMSTALSCLCIVGGLTVYCFGDPAKMADANARLALRIHDECNSSDVFSSNICTCRPYLIFGIEEAVKEAQKGGSGVVIYFRKEGRALGEVTKVASFLPHPFTITDISPTYSISFTMPESVVPTEHLNTFRGPRMWQE